MVKKRRTPAQIRATKKLVALNKKRRGKKKAVRRRTSKKKVIRKVRRKRRTPAQVRATKKLVALNKRKGKKKSVRKVTRKKSVKRKSNPNSSTYVMVARNTKTGKTGYYTGKSFDTDIKKALTSKSKSTISNLTKKVRLGRDWDLFIAKGSSLSSIKAIVKR